MGERLYVETLTKKKNTEHMKITFTSLQLFSGFRLGYLGLSRGNSGLGDIAKNGKPARISGAKFK